MKDTGSKLKNARIAQNISLEEVAQSTKIKVQTIIALEEGDLDRLPKKAFIRGFVRTYGGFLKLNVNELLDSFHKEMGSTQKQTLLQSNDTLSDDPAVQIANSKRNPFTRGVMAAVIAVILIVIYMTSRVIQKYQDEKLVAEDSLQVEPIATAAPSSDPSVGTATSAEGVNVVSAEETIGGATTTTTTTMSPTPATTGATPTTIPTTTVSPTPIATVKPLPSATPLVVATATATPTPKPTASATPKPTPTATPTPKPTPTATPTPKPTPTATPKPSPTTTPKVSPTPSATPVVNARPQEVIVEALDRVEIQFATDGQKMIRVKLEPEQIYTIKANSNIQFRATDGGAINLIHNGRDQGVPGTLGEKLETKFPK
jgi:cytoskeleton protein RodZ